MSANNALAANGILDQRNRPSHKEHTSAQMKSRGSKALRLTSRMAVRRPLSYEMAWTTMPGRARWTGTATMSPSSIAVAPMNTVLPVRSGLRRPSRMSM